MPDLSDLIRRVEEAKGPDRELDWEISYLFGLGSDNERAIYAEHGPAGFTAKDSNGFTALDRKNGCWVNYSRPGREGRRVRLREPERVRAITGPQPLIRCAAYTASLDAALALVDEKLPDFDFSVVKIGGHYGALVSLEDVRPGALRPGATLPLAVLLALLRALQSQHEGK